MRFGLNIVISEILFVAGRYGDFEQEGDGDFEREGDGAT